MAATRAGDDRAFERLYRRYQRRIAAYVHGMVNDHGRAEDITQEVFMSALRRMRETDRPIIFKPWVYEIAKNACIDAFRRARRAEEVSYDAEEGLGGSDHGRLVSRTPTPDVAVDTRMSLDHLRGAFGGLSETHHDILVMRELEGLSYREIGERLGMSRPSVESTLFRARRRLSEEYEELTSGERCRRVQGLIAGLDGRRLGVRDERQMARHVSHCQPCRRAAYAAGVDLAALAARRSLGAKVAALLPLPAFVRRWFGGGGDAGAASSSSGGGGLTHWSAALSQYAEPLAGGWTKAAAVAATVAVAGVGAGVATTKGDETTAGKGSTPAAVAPAAPAGARATPPQAPSPPRAARERRAAGADGRGGSSASPATTAAGRPGATPRDGAPAGAGTPATPGASSSRPGTTATGATPAGSGDGTSTSTPSKPTAGAGDDVGSAVGDTVGRLVAKPGGSGSGSGSGGGSTPSVSVPPVSVPKVPASTGSAPVDTAVNAAGGAVNDATGAATGAVSGVTGAVTGTTAPSAPAAPTGNATGTTSGPAPSDLAGTATGATGAVTGTATGAVGAVTDAAGGALPGG